MVTNPKLSELNFLYYNLQELASSRQYIKKNHLEIQVKIILAAPATTV